MRLYRNLISTIGLPVIALFVAVPSWAGGVGSDHGHDHGHGHGGEAIRITLWEAGYEVFAEHPPIAVGEPAEFVIHLTRLADGAPRVSGPLTLRCRHEEGATLEVSSPQPARRGIYEIGPLFDVAGSWVGELVFPTEHGERIIPLPPMVVHESPEVAAGAVIPEAPEGISFLKEQQWPIGMLISPVVEHVIGGVRGPAVPVSAVVESDAHKAVVVQLDGETFEERHANLGQSDGDLVQVLSGLRPGEQVVTKGALDVLAAGTMDVGGHELGGHEPHVVMSDLDLIRYDVGVGTASPGEIQSEMEVPGEIALNGHRTAQIVAHAQGMVGSLRARLGDEVQAGQVVAVLMSRELADAKSVYLTALQREELTTAAFEREERLLADRITSDQEYIEARHALSEARIGTRAARQKLLAMGLSDREIRGLQDAPDSLLTRFEIRAPFAGSIIERNAELGEVAGADAALFKVADLRTVWLDLHLPSRDLQRVAAGQSVTLVQPDVVRGVRGKVEYVHPIVDERSRTAFARVTLDNSDGQLRPGMFVSARVAAEKIAAPVVVPRSAVQYLDDQPVVFVRIGEEFVAREIVLGGGAGDLVAVTAGLRAGERLAVSNSFLLKSEIEKQTGGEVGHGHAH